MLSSPLRSRTLRPARLLVLFSLLVLTIFLLLNGCGMVSNMTTTSAGPAGFVFVTNSGSGMVSAFAANVSLEGRANWTGEPCLCSGRYILFESFVS